jgi:hypothetical protein
VEGREPGREAAGRVCFSKLSRLGFFGISPAQTAVRIIQRLSLQELAMKPDRSSLVLVLGILSLMFPPIGIVAFIMGRSYLRGIDAGQRDPKGREMTRAGMICGIVGMVLFGLIVLVDGLGILVLAELLTEGGGPDG